MNDNKTMKTFLIFIIQAYQEFDKVTGTIKDLCTIEVIDTTAEKAVAKAKTIIKKKFYRISSVIEKEVPMSPVYFLDNKNGAN